MKKLIPSPVVIFILVGLLFTAVGQGKLFSSVLPLSVITRFPVDDYMKSIGFALIGSGIFTTILKTREYMKLLDDTLQRNLYSAESLKKRGDKEVLWTTLTRMLYNQKFDSVSLELENLIKEHYFFTNSNWYVSDYNITLNISTHAHNKEYWVQNELIKLSLTPSKTDTVVDYIMTVRIDKPLNDPSDISNCICNNATINNIALNGNAITTENNASEVIQHINCKGQHANTYQIVVDRTKILNKLINPEKSFLAKQIIKNMTVTLIHDVGINLEFRKSGTINDFKLVQDQIGAGSRYRIWFYEGLILPHQGYIILFK